MGNGSRIQRGTPEKVRGERVQDEREEKKIEEGVGSWMEKEA